MQLGQDGRPLPVKLTVNKGQLVKVAYSDPAKSLTTNSVLLHVMIERKDGSEKQTFSLLVPPAGTVEIGMIEGWSPQNGDHVHLEAAGFQTVDLRNL